MLLVLLAFQTVQQGQACRVFLAYQQLLLRQSVQQGQSFRVHQVSRVCLLCLAYQPFLVCQQVRRGQPGQRCRCLRWHPPRRCRCSWSGALRCRPICRWRCGRAPTGCARRHWRSWHQLARYRCAPSSCWSCCTHRARYPHHASYPVAHKSGLLYLAVIQHAAAFDIQPSLYAHTADSAVDPSRLGTGAHQRAHAGLTWQTWQARRARRACSAITAPTAGAQQRGQAECESERAQA